LGRDSLLRSLKPEQIVIDLVNLEKLDRPEGSSFYQGICW
jgi:hypothetical protein